ncbi:MAG: AMP-binding protein [Rhodospirillaceae bacterium]|nr:AMP-binding protein [Rhodospirillaceae bacterium]
MAVTPSSTWTIGGKTELTYGEAAARVEALAALYRAAGYGAGHRVALLLYNRPEHFLHLLALNSLGVGIVPVNPDYAPDEMLYQLEHSEADLAVSVPNRVADLEAVARRRAKPLPVVDAFDLPARLPSPATQAAGGTLGPATEAALFYTSGTTGRPKGCIIANSYFLNVGNQYARFGGLIAIRPGEDRILNPLPTFHQNCGAVTFSMALLTGNCLVTADRFHARSWWKDVAATRATVIHYLGIMVPALLNQPETPEETQHALRFGFGAGVDSAGRARFEQRFRIPIVEGWAMTETGNFFKDAFEPRQTDRRAIGKPNAWMEGRIVDEQDREVPRGTPGELTVRAPGADPRRGFYSGYLKDPAATDIAWRGGWFHTGDTCLQQEDGMIVFLDRKKNIIRRSGENIAAAEVEACLQTHPAVERSAVLAVPDEMREEEVMACVVLKPGHAADAATAAALTDFALEKLAYYKAPGWVMFRDSVPLTSTQKVQKTQLFPPGTDPRKLQGAFDLRERKKHQKR